MSYRTSLEESHNKLIGGCACDTSDAQSGSSAAPLLKILTGDAIEQLRTLLDESVHCCVTSPPYWGLRDYGTAAWEGGDEGCDHVAPAGISGGQRADRTFTLGEIYKSECGKCGAKRIDSQLGLERTPEEYVAKMVEVFREVRRVLRKDGTCWINLGDAYAHSGACGGGSPLSNPTDGRIGDQSPRGRKDDRIAQLKTGGTLSHGLKPKDLCGIPWRVAFALQADGWWLRSDIIWAKPNPMPESVTDRPTKAHEYLFLLTKASSYFYDAEAIKERSLWADDPRADQGHNGADGQGQRAFCSIDSSGRNKRSVWTVATAPYPEAHFATYPPDLIKPCIMAGTSAKGCCARCGAPWERLLKSTPMVINRTDRIGEMGEFGRYQSSGTMIESAKSETIGWQPTCDCDDMGPPPLVVPCTVLDPFAGSGTTGAVALELGRKAVLIELNPKYVALSRQRCDITPGLQLA